MAVECVNCQTVATSDEEVFLDIDHSDDAMWHQQDPGSYNQVSVVVCAACMNANWSSWRSRLISLRRIPRPFTTVIGERV
jgi:hypothetical protein